MRPAPFLRMPDSSAERTVSWRWFPIGLLLAAALVFWISWSHRATAQDSAGPAPGSPPVATRSPNPRDARVPLADRLSEDPETRVLELLFVLRHYRVFHRDDEMAQAIRELSRLGKPAVRGLVDELERTRSEVTLRVLAIALRTTGDPAAIPPLIRAISRSTRPQYGYCRVSLHDPGLRPFAAKIEDHPGPPLPTMRLDLAVNEILETLMRLAGEPVSGGEPDIGGEPDAAKRGFERWQQLLPDLQSQAFFRHQAAWVSWWQEKHGAESARREFAQLEAPAAAAPEAQQDDAVERAGEARFGPIFPTGPAARLGPVREVDLFDTLYVEVPSAIDFDTGRVGRLLEGSPPTPEGYRTWMLRRGVDMAVGANWEDTTAWQIEPDRWGTIDAEIREPRSLPRGAERPDNLMPWPEGRTMLFTTREGGSGILQVGPRQPDRSWRFRYRMWETPFSPAGPPGPAVEPARSNAAAGAARWGEPVNVTLQAPGEERSCAWSLSRDEYVALPRNILSRELSDQLWLKGDEIALHVWRRKERVSFLTRRASPVDRQLSIEVDLFLFDCVVRRVQPEAFANMTASTAAELLDEPAAGKPLWAVQFPREIQMPQPQTYLFRTAAGERGLMQIRGSSLTGGLPTFRYKRLLP